MRVVLVNMCNLREEEGGQASKKSLDYNGIEN
jgi:hypothetical protein